MSFKQWKAYDKIVDPALKEYRKASAKASQIMRVDLDPTKEITPENRQRSITRYMNSMKIAQEKLDEARGQGTKAFNEAEG